jgi:N-acetylmuramoyl-L-alanine amidase
MRKIKSIAIHCSAGFGNVASIRAFWKTKGWNKVGYHILIDLEGVSHVLAPFDETTNGILGHNNEIINICYIGGVQKNESGKLVAKDTRTDKQKYALTQAIKLAIKYAEESKSDLQTLTIQGHRDFSPDKNGNGVIESWERIKECPCFDAIPEYRHLLIGTDSKNVHEVKNGETLTSISRLHGISISDLKTLNSLINLDRLSIGQILILNK